MAVAQANIYAAPFDAIAERYDETFTSSKIGRTQRASVWKELGKAFRPGDRVLEIGCGTGVDACFLAERGVTVVACDSSRQMVAATTRRVKESGNDLSVHPSLLAAEDLRRLQNGPFDGAFSNFGALNCVEDLRGLATDLAVLLKPDATALLCWMGSCCLWEIAWYFAHGKPGKAFRRFHRHGITAQVAQGASIRVRYPSVRELARVFAPMFGLKSVKGVGVTVPPSYLEAWANRFPGLFDLSVRADSLLGYCPGIRVLADHVLLEFRREDTPVQLAGE